MPGAQQLYARRRGERRARRKEEGKCHPDRSAAEWMDLLLYRDLTSR
jgi:hypothetical protein